MREFIYRIEDDKSDESEVFIGWIRQHGKELVRCKDCKWYDMTDAGGTIEPIVYRCRRGSRLWREPHDFCSKAERKEQ